MAVKTKLTSGADERTPSLPQYFSWISHTNEGATQEQTLINLEYFKWLHDTYGMELKIYAWDAGNLDGAKETYQHPAESAKIKAQYPQGYKPCADAAARFGCHLGVWAGPDGFGDTPEEEKKRYELIVSLCRDLGFMQFKFDAVCGDLRPQKQAVFKKMVDECRKYVPELIVLNHRIDLGEAEICASTFLLGGMETYIDVMCKNEISAPHHRVVTMGRDLVPGMQRLTEDHGVCLSSCMDYFEDEMIIHAFARSLILCPEIYGNPWLLKDCEQERLAGMYNLHRKYRDILVDGIALPESYGTNTLASGDPNGTSRGNEKTRLVTLCNVSWQQKKIVLHVDSEIGLFEEGSRYVVKTLFPYESYVGTYAYGETVNLTVDPFRSALILVQEEASFLAEDYVLTNCVYRTVYGQGAQPEKLQIFGGNGKKISCLGNRTITAPAVTEDHTVHVPVAFGELTDCALPAEAEQLYEATAFLADGDSLEAQSLKRAGKTAIPQVQQARDAFFGQLSYRARGPEARFLFDGNEDSFYDGTSRCYNRRVEGGCLRVDLGEIYRVSRIEIVCFAIKEPIMEVLEQQIPEKGSFSTDRLHWMETTLTRIDTEAQTITIPVMVHKVHNTIYPEGYRKTAVYTINGDIRYFRLPCPMDRIFAFRVYDEAGKEMVMKAPYANSMLGAFDHMNFTTAKALTVTVPENVAEGSYVAIGIDGVHGVEGVYCAGLWNGKPVGCYDRAVSFPFQAWEGKGTSDRGYTYYLKVEPGMQGQELTLYALFRNSCQVTCRAWLCDNPLKMPITEIVL